MIRGSSARWRLPTAHGAVPAGARWRLLLGAVLAGCCACRALPGHARGFTAADSTHNSSPATAFVIALVPGALVHGAGHAYVGDLRTARWLALSEAAGYAAMFTSHVRGADTTDRTDGRAIVYGVGASLFFGSWLYDILAAPAAARAPSSGAHATAALPGWEMAMRPRRHGVAMSVMHRF